MALAVVAVYRQVLGYPFIKFDEEIYVTKNPHVLAGISLDGVVWAIKSLDGGSWHPLTWLSHMLDCQIYGLEPGGHHLTNLLLHIANTLLLFWFFNRTTGAFWKSSFVAALFALHPLHVESVAWVAERKDVLSTFFWLLAMQTYVSYVEVPGIHRYLLVLLVFFLGLMAKSMVVTLPLVLLLLDIWPLKRYRSGHGDESDARVDPERLKKPIGKEASAARLVLEKLPMIVLAASLGLITIVAQQHAGALNTLEAFPLEPRMANALISYVRYIGKMVWPYGLAIFYPHPVSWPFWQVAASGLLLVVLSYVVMRWSKRYPYLAVGWLWYMGTLIPVIGFIQVGSQAIADRYTYVPLIGLFIMIAWGVPELLKKWHYQGSFLFVSAFGLLLLLMIISSAQVRCWQNSVTLFAHATEVTENNYLAHGNLAAVLMDQGDLDQAYYHNRQALKIKPHHSHFNMNMGEFLVMQGKMDEAIFHFREALRYAPNNAAARRDLADTLFQKGLYEEAIGEYQWLLQRTPDNPELHNNLGVALALSGQVDAAVVHLQEALRLKPDYAAAKDNLVKVQKEARGPRQAQ